MKFLKFVFIVAIVAPMTLTSCGDKEADYSFSFDVPDSIAYNYGMYDATRLGLQSMDMDEFEKGARKGFALTDAEEDKSEVDSSRSQMELFSNEYFGAEEAKKKADSTYVSPPLDLPKGVSYHLGVIVGNGFVGSPLAKMDLTDYLKGIKGYFADKSSFDQIAADRMLKKYFETADSLRIIVNEKYLADNKEKEGVITTPTGLQYKVLKEGNGEKPKGTEQVKVHYKGTLVNGKEFDSSIGKDPFTFSLQGGVIPGWIEGVKLMDVGAKYQFVIPQDLGYGERGAGQAIGPKSTLIFEVELLDILPDVPQPQPEVPANALPENIKIETPKGN